MFKKLMQQSWFHHCISAAIFGYLKFVGWTTRWDIINPNISQAFRENSPQPVLYALWHNRIALAPFQLNHGVKCLVSAHRDGRLVPETLKFFGMEAITISSKDGAKIPLRQLLREIKNGTSIILTPDGPRGPRQRVKPGIIGLSRLSGLPIIVISCAFSNRLRLNSWDHFMLPLPWGRGIIQFAKLDNVPKDASLDEQESYRQNLEKIMNEQALEIETQAGLSPIVPADPTEKIKGYKPQDLYISPPKNTDPPNPHRK